MDTAYFCVAAASSIHRLRNTPVGTLDTPRMNGTISILVMTAWCVYDPTRPTGMAA
jgi:hypothetical protein